MKIENLPKSRFMVFDRYEIHIQALVLFSHGKLIIFQSSSTQKKVVHIYTQQYLPTNISSNTKHFFQTNGGCVFQKNEHFQISRDSYIEK